MTLFKRLDEDGGFDSLPLRRALAGSPGDVADGHFTLIQCGLFARNLVAIFRGLLPLSGPWEPSMASRSLPWFTNEYWSYGGKDERPDARLREGSVVDSNGGIWEPKSVAKEIEEIGEHFLKYRDSRLVDKRDYENLDEAERDDCLPVVFRDGQFFPADQNPARFHDDRRWIQATAVDLLMCIDVLLDRHIAAEEQGRVENLFGVGLSTTWRLGVLHERARTVATSSVLAETIVNRIKEGAVKGGKASGATRRQQSKVPSPKELQAERDRLIAMGRPTRGIAGMLAKKYDCTAAHIRNQLDKKTEPPSMRN